MVAKVSRISKELLPAGIRCKGGFELLRLASGHREGRESEIGDAIPIWANGMSKPARVRLLRGKAEYFRE